VTQKGRIISLQQENVTNFRTEGIAHSFVYLPRFWLLKLRCLICQSTCVQALIPQVQPGKCCNTCDCISFYAEESLVLEFHSTPSKRKMTTNRPVYAIRISRLTKRAKRFSILLAIFWLSTNKSDQDATETATKSSFLRLLILASFLCQFSTNDYLCLGFRALFSLSRFPCWLDNPQGSMTSRSSIVSRTKTFYRDHWCPFVQYPSGDIDYKGNKWHWWIRFCRALWTFIQVSTNDVLDIYSLSTANVARCTTNRVCSRLHFIVRWRSIKLWKPSTTSFYTIKDILTL